MSETKILFPKKLPDMPKAGWKDSFDAFKVKDNREKKVKEKKPPKEIKKTPLKKPTKPIKKVGARKTKRIAEYGTESDFFYAEWIQAGGDKQVVTCACGCGEPVRDPFIYDPVKEKWKLVKPQCFAHILAKGMYPKLRYVPGNIAIVSSFDCHRKIDEQWNDLEKRRIKEQELLQLI